MTGRRKMPKLLDITLKVMLSVAMVTGKRVDNYRLEGDETMVGN